MCTVSKCIYTRKDMQEENCKYQIQDGCKVSLCINRNSKQKIVEILFAIFVWQEITATPPSPSSPPCQYKNNFKSWIQGIRLSCFNTVLLFSKFCEEQRKGGAIRSEVHSFYYDNFSTTIKTFKRLWKRKSAQNTEQFKVGDVFFKLEKNSNSIEISIVLFLCLCECKRCFQVFYNIFYCMSEKQNRAEI